MVEVVKSERGAGWIVPWLRGHLPRHEYVALACDGTGAAASLIPELEHEGIEVKTFSAAEHASACGGFYDLVESESLRQIGQHELIAALRGASKRHLGGAWAWNRRTSLVDISPLVAVTLALGAFRSESFAPQKPAPRILSLHDLPD
jgi:hypothetical protein